MITYDKDTLFREFKDAKSKDVALSKKKKLEDKEIDIYVNRIQFFKDHIRNKTLNPKVYDLLDINFEELLKAMKVNLLEIIFICQYLVNHSNKKCGKKKLN